ncbi:CubicO group peptidase (beta-lactamase class C family) [Rhodococcus sp. PvR044]|uniref:serine hydrolase domain-containing protein n=1 Tax=unclassified Rhodococcus (in: high G+C Gram-positive bacteria) TaxID=192944 RepID=UPI000BCB5E40|nr:MULTISPECIES: serine hydrolase domain-containing protein [unclassified Rhodococcus (in: high G+C Gram-positive bacteria)]PTR42835.1 CubicO group peptidase (beta-lactamase class C family) [Rhodococcus sp. OK611]SNX91808.1 CubicO group peptidase, beta-lactamase class C family [Rhodococcus sp. OK270]
MAMIRRVLVLVSLVGLVAACTSTDTASPPPSPADPAQTDAVKTIVREAMAEGHLKSVIVRATVDGREILTEAVGESMTGVPATTDMHFRNGAVAISYVSTLLLQLVDEGKVSLDDKVSTWLPYIPHSDLVTLGQLAQMTSGYPDYVLGATEFDAAIYADPFRRWTPEELIAPSTAKPLLYEPGTNWNYAHTNYVILGLALEKITGKRMTDLMQERVLGPLGLTNTTDPGTAAITEPALHAFSSERREALQIPAGAPFYEESTYWNPSWTITRGAVQTTDISDMHDTAVAIGTGKLLSAESYKKMVSTDLRGKTTTLPGCPTCTTMSEGYTYGLGIIITGDWLMQNPLFSGYAAAEAYLPSKKVAIAVAVTYDQEAFDDAGLYKNEAESIFRKIGAQLAPGDAPPPPPQR